MVLSLPTTIVPVSRDVVSSYSLETIPPTVANPNAPLFPTSSPIASLIFVYSTARVDNSQIIGVRLACRSVP